MPLIFVSFLLNKGYMVLARELARQYQSDQISVMVVPHSRG
ncbi:hypothetical protein D515_01588 [Grimontia indica]|uniref:Uncharacterized protein n=1 Tax=Grimontia indica TaxID=1056512 RepID=R1IW21_9GAMM|nr:hypothetical protein D515_01588 [Grimontia indica]